ncbi:hypothetical protein J7L48_06640 [bacterium]|nr:hypothetical protein [bacterium]
MEKLGDQKKLLLYYALYLGYLYIGILLMSFIRFPHRISYPLYVLLLGVILFFKLLFPLKIRIKKWILIIISISMLVISAKILFNLKIHSLQMKQKFYSAQETMRKFKSIYGNNNIILSLDPCWGYDEGASPLREFKDFEKYQGIVCGWSTRSKSYYDTLKKYGFRSGKDLMENISRNDIVIIVRNIKPMRRFIAIFEKYLNEHYTEGKNIKYNSKILFSSKNLIFFKIYR